MLKKLDNGMFYLELEGDTYHEIGYKHGFECRELIKKGMDGFAKMVYEESGMKYSDFVEAYLKDTEFIDDMKRLVPNILEEMEGIAEGAGTSVEEIYVYSALDDVYSYLINEFGNSNGKHPEHCTSIGCYKRKDIPNIVAHNNDVAMSYDGTQIVLKIKYPDSDLEIITATFAGFVQQAGLNNHSIAVTVNTVGSLRSSSKGLTSTVVMRGILEKKTLDEAITWIREIPHSGGINYSIGDQERSVTVECSKNEVHVIENMGGKGFVVHTNHPIVSTDIDKDSKLTKILEESIASEGMSMITTLERYNAAYDILLERVDELTVSDFKKILSTKPINNDLEITTLISVIMELTNEPTIWVSGKLPTEDSYVEVKF